MLPKLPIVIVVIVFLYLTYRVIPVHKYLPEPNASGDQSFKHGCSMTDIGIKLMSRYLIGALSGALSVIIYAALKVSVNAITPWIVSYFPVLLFRQEERNTPVLRRRTSVGAKYFPRHYDGTSD
ncbi:uncharacterized protein LOC131948208 isoform X3 [Physella acuta]|uniref:uncharacterized protein LOC131948208 isoform X3 n=1 Tax=Physella acuta TaxID=109671 RepID=UPI0027DC605F|nr:uncharacterized protein LOC131948208 isoform X3 [Physella acuta]